MELFKIFPTSALTIIVGVVIFVSGQWILKFIIEPIKDFNRVRDKIAYSLIFYANVYMNTPPPYADLSEDRRARDEVQKVYRQLASQLCPKASMIPWFKIWYLIKIVPSFQNIRLATDELIGLSNSIHDVNANFNRTRRERIQRLLNIENRNGT